mmetsp:Transcript_2307/g.1649  ORF Transcript_2307/g.1649 Transcript_2307/m.1649 type:complete len:182 (+) Transcript_2307:417-962(+)
MEWKKETDFGRYEGFPFKETKFTSNDPAPPFNFVKNPEYQDLKLLEDILLDNSKDLFIRYRALFTLRDLNTPDSVIAICQALLPSNSSRCSALLKHEVAFVLAQMEETNQVGIPYLVECVKNEEEAPIVRHELLVSLGDMVEEKDKAVIEQFVTHKEQIIYESALVGLSYIQNRQFVEVDS